MAAKIAGVQNSFSGALDQEHIGVEGGVIGKDRGDRERPIGKGPERLRHVRKVRLSEFRVMSAVIAISLADPDPVHIGHSAGSSSTKPPMVLMRMADQDRG